MVFACSEAPFSRLGRLLGASRGWFWASWRRLGSVLERLRRILGRLGPSWSVLGAFRSAKRAQKGERAPDMQPCVAAGNPQYQRRRDTLQLENYQTSTDLFRESNTHSGRLQARCGYKAQQSCVPATALSVFRGSQC